MTDQNLVEWVGDMGDPGVWKGPNAASRSMMGMGGCGHTSIRSSS